MSASDEEFGKAVTRVLVAVKAADDWEKAHGSIFGQVRSISCPNCLQEAALKFMRGRGHLYIECSTPECVAAGTRVTTGRK